MNRKTQTLIKGLAFAALIAALCTAVWLNSRRIGADREGLGRNFEFDIDRYMDVDPAMLIYDEIQPITLDAQSVTALAAGPDGRIYVGADSEVRSLNSAGGELSRIALASTPLCLAVASNGTVYVGTDGHIEVFDAGGTKTAAWDPLSDNALPVSIALRGDDVFVSELTRAQVTRYDLAGQPVAEIKGLVLFGSSNIGISIDPKGKLWVVNPGLRELRCYDDNGTVAASWHRSGRELDSFSGCCNPVDIMVRADGSIVTAEKNIVRIKVVSPEGKLIGVVAGPQSFDQTISHLDITQDPDGRILVLDPVRKAIRIFVEKKK